MADQPRSRRVGESGSRHFGGVHTEAIAMSQRSGGTDKPNPHTTPVFTSSSGKVNLSIWEKPGKYGPMWSVKFQVVWYDDHAKEWKHSDGFNPENLGDLLACVMESMQYIAHRRRKMRDAPEQQDERPKEAPPKGEPLPKGLQTDFDARNQQQPTQYGAPPMKPPF